MQKLPTDFTNKNFKPTIIDNMAGTHPYNGRTFSWRDDISAQNIFNERTNLGKVPSSNPSVAGHSLKGWQGYDPIGLLPLPNFYFKNVGSMQMYYLCCDIYVNDMWVQSWSGSGASPGGGTYSISIPGIYHGCFVGIRNIKASLYPHGTPQFNLHPIANDYNTSILNGGEPDIYIGCEFSMGRAYFKNSHYQPMYDIRWEYVFTDKQGGTIGGASGKYPMLEPEELLDVLVVELPKHTYMVTVTWFEASKTPIDSPDYNLIQCDVINNPYVVRYGEDNSYLYVTFV